MLARVSRYVAIALVAALVLIVAAYVWDINQAYKRVSGRSAVMSSPHGDIEYTEGGAGPDVLVIHGSGGGFDQGELMVHAVLGDQFHWVAPSRFGYLRSTFHEDATFDEQAHAYASLLDGLGINKVAVVALSHGGPSALLFSVLYPERVTSLTLISCGVASLATEDQAKANEKGAMWVSIFKYDPLYWGITRLFNRQLLELMGANDAVITTLTPEQRAMAEQVIDYMNPVAPRFAGAAFDNKAAMPNERIRAIQAPTLIFHAKDDTLQLYHNAEFAAANIPGATLRSFDRGGHLLMIVEQETIRAAVQQHILDQLG